MINTLKIDISWLPTRVKSPPAAREASAEKQSTREGAAFAAELRTLVTGSESFQWNFCDVKLWPSQAIKETF